MKKITLLLLNITLVFSVIYSQPKKPRDLDRQNTRSDSLRIIVDDVSFSTVKFITAATLSPRIKEETESTISLDKDAYYLRISNNISTTENKTKLRYIVPELIDLNETTDLLDAGFIFVNNDNSIGDRKMGYLNFLTDVTTHATFTSAVDARITVVVDESFILNLITDNITQDFYLGASKVGELYLQKIGNIVSGILRVTNTGTGVALSSASGSNYALPSDFRPVYATRFRNVGGSFNTFWISAANGQFTLDFDEGVGDGTNNIGFSYVTPF